MKIPDGDNESLVQVYHVLHRFMRMLFAFYRLSISCRKEINVILYPFFRAFPSNVFESIVVPFFSETPIFHMYQSFFHTNRDSRSVSVQMSENYSIRRLILPSAKCFELDLKSPWTRQTQYLHCHWWKLHRDLGLLLDIWWQLPSVLPELCNNRITNKPRTKECKSKECFGIDKRKSRHIG